MVARALKCAEALAEKGIEAEVIDMRTIKPLDAATVIKSAEKTGRLAFMEEAVGCGGIGEQLAAYLTRRGAGFKVKLIALPDAFVPHATMAELEELYGLTTEKLLEKIGELL